MIPLSFLSARHEKWSCLLLVSGIIRENIPRIFIGKHAHNTYETDENADRRRQTKRWVCGMEETIKGSQSLIFKNAPYLISAASVTGSKEAEGPLGKLFDMTSEDDLFGAQTWEEAESTMQKEACVLALGKAHVEPAAVRYLFGGDLLRQGIATSMGVEGLQIPMFGLYGACSTSGEALALAAMSAAAGYGEYMLAVTSSHFGSAEKEFRFPLGYANQRPLSAHWTVTGSGAFLVRSAERAAQDCHVELTTLIVPGENDSEEEMDREARWIASLDWEIPLHVTRFFPQYRMADKAPTPVERVYRLRNTAAQWLRYVYVGNC